MEPRFQSILFEQAGPPVAEPVGQPAFFSDLNLDQVRDAMLAGRNEYELDDFFHRSLRDSSTVYYRHAIVQDLERDPVRAAIERFVSGMRATRELMTSAKRSHYKLQKQRRHLEAIDVYCRAAISLAEDLASTELESCGFQRLLEELSDYVASGPFGALKRDTEILIEELGQVRYSTQISGAHVRVGRYDGEPDYSAEVQETFSKFREGPAKKYVADVHDFGVLNHVEARILGLVARLHPETFARLAQYCDQHRTFLNPTLARFDREVQLYLAYLEYISPLKAAGLRFCYPGVSTDTNETVASDAFDLALAVKLVGEERLVVTNDFGLTQTERILVVTGPNQGGKTTFARMFGQLHHLASLGLPVPAASARLALPDRVFTHFEREEDLANLRGKLDDELVRIHEILAQATGDSIVVLNESFASTTLSDALFLGTELIGRLTDLGALCVYVTFVDELSSLGEATVSMVATVDLDDPALRTFKIVRRQADGLAYAAAIADKYGLRYDALRRRIAR